MYCVMCIDKPDSGALRQENRPAHLEYVVSQDYVKMGGPLVGDDGETMIGSLLLLDVDNRAAAQAFVDNDPYHKAGLFERIEVQRFKHLLGGLDNPQG